MKKLIIFCLLTLLAIGLASVASAGEYWMIVATDGEGIAVYGSSGGGRQVGTLYNGYQNHLSLEPTNGRYSCGLTKDTTVWLNDEKAMKRLPDNVYGASSEGADQVPCSCFLAEVTEDGAGLGVVIGGFLYALTVLHDTSMAVKIAVLGVFYIVTNPIAGHAIAKAAYRHGVRPEKDMTIDKYGEDLEQND